MVEALGPAKFYGSSLPRPRIYTDVKFNEGRVDPPISAIDPLISWAEEAHWSMGGLTFQRHRLQGRIEGNINKLRSDRERTFKKKAKIVIFSEKDVSSPSPPPAPMVVKRKRRMVDEDEEEVEIPGMEYRRRIVRKLKDEFDSVAVDDEVVGLEGRDSNKKDNVVEKGNRGRGIGRRLVKGLKAVAVAVEGEVASRPRTSQRLSKT